MAAADADSSRSSEPAVAGVVFRPPPVDLQASVSRALADAVQTLPPGKTGAVVALVNECGANAAVVAKLGGHWEVQAWIGKTWTPGVVQYGGLVRTSW